MILLFIAILMFGGLCALFKYTFTVKVNIFKRVGLILLCILASVLFFIVFCYSQGICLFA